MFVRSAILILFSATGAMAQTGLDTAQQWLARTMLQRPLSRPLDRAAAERQMSASFLMLKARLPEFSSIAKNYTANRIPRQRSQRIAVILEKDLDNDGRVTTEELTAFLEPQSKMALRTTGGLQIEPTAEQSAEILAQLLEQNLQSDLNKDGVIDFDEMRASADAAIDRLGPALNRRLPDPAIVKLIDTSGDKIISREEYLSAVRKTFDLVDANKDDSISPEEACLTLNSLKPKAQGLTTCF